MSFRKDELVIPEESDDEDDEENDNIIMKDKIIHSVEEAYELVDNIEEKMNKITNAIRGMDKRMSYNLRLLGSLIMVDGNNDSVELSNEESMKQVNNILVNKTLGEKKQKVVPKLKKMSDFVVNKLNLVTPEDKKQIELVKKKLQSIDLTNVNSKMQIKQKGMGNFVLEKYMAQAQNKSNKNVIENLQGKPHPNK